IIRVSELAMITMTDNTVSSFKGSVWVTSICLVAGFSLTFGAPLVYGQVETKSPASNPVSVTIRIPFFPVAMMGGLSTENKSSPSAFLEFEAITYNPPLKLDPVARKDWKSSSPEEALRGFLTVSQAGNLEQMTAAWTPEDRINFKADFLKDTKKLERETTLY